MKDCTSFSPPSSGTIWRSDIRLNKTIALSDDFMLLKISHFTNYRYDEPVHYALQQLRLMPRSGVGQNV